MPQASLISSVCSLLMCPETSSLQPPMPQASLISSVCSLLMCSETSSLLLKNRSQPGCLQRTISATPPSSSSPPLESTTTLSAFSPCLLSTWALRSVTRTLH